VRNANCKLCGLHAGARTVCIPGDGPKDADILVVGSHPGMQEDRQEKPFVSAPGKIFKAQLEKANLYETTSVRYTHVVRCATPDNREPTAKEIKACKPYLDAEIKLIDPKYIVPLGALPTKALAKAKITTAHGQMIEKEGRIVVPVYHPAATFRDPSKLQVIQQDLGRLKRQIDGTLGETQDAFKYRVVTSREALAEFWKAFEAADEFAYDTETNGLFLKKPDFVVRCIAFALPECSWVIPLEMPGSLYEGDHLAQGALLRVVARKAEGKWVSVFHGKYDSGALRTAYGVSLAYQFDAMLAHYLINENQDHDLKYVSRVELDCPEYDLPKALKLSDKPEWLELMQDPANREKYWMYNGRDAWNTLHLALKFAQRFRRNAKLRRLYNNLVMPSSYALEAIEAEGLPIDKTQYSRMETETLFKKNAAMQTLNEAVEALREAPAEVNWNSPQQIAQVLFQDAGLPIQVFTPTGAPSTSEAAIVDLKGKHPIVNELLHYRELDKILGTYLEGWKQYIIGDRIYFSYKQTGTVTGRFSSRLHQIPTDSDIRSIIATGEDSKWQFVAADLSQAELRIAAEMSGDIQMISAYRDGKDVHWKTLMFMLGSGATDASELSLQTATMYCLRHMVPADRTGCEVLQKVWKANQGREATESLLGMGHTNREEQESRRGVRRRTMGEQKPVLERRNISDSSTPLEEKVLRAVREYQALSCASQESHTQRQSKIQLSDALSLLSCLPPSIAYEFSKDWKDWRNKAKRVNFAFLYGMYENKFIERALVDYDWSCSYVEAHRMRQAYFELYTGLEPWHNRCKRIAHIDGFVTNMFGRVRRLPAIQSSDKLARMEAERQAVNSPVQGTIGDWKAASMVEIHETIDKDQFRLCGEHHDALLGLVRRGCEDDVLPRVRRIMERPKLLKTFKISMAVPMVTDINVGAWGRGTVYKDPK
jgi:uracil-DNA glycosylase